MVELTTRGEEEHIQTGHYLCYISIVNYIILNVRLFVFVFLACVRNMFCRNEQQYTKDRNSQNEKKTICFAVYIGIKY